MNNQSDDGGQTNRMNDSQIDQFDSARNQMQFDSRNHHNAGDNS